MFKIMLSQVRRVVLEAYWKLTTKRAFELYREVYFLSPGVPVVRMTKYLYYFERENYYFVTAKINNSVYLMLSKIPRQKNTQ